MASESFSFFASEAAGDISVVKKRISRRTSAIRSDGSVGEGIKTRDAAANDFCLRILVLVIGLKSSAGRGRFTQPPGRVRAGLAGSIAPFWRRDHGAKIVAAAVTGGRNERGVRVLASAALSRQRINCAEDSALYSPINRENLPACFFVVWQGRARSSLSCVKAFI